MKTYIILELARGFLDWQEVCMETQEAAIKWMQKYVERRKELDSSYSVGAIYELGENIATKVLENTEK